jgi:hypothetical protein
MGWEKRGCLGDEVLELWRPFLGVLERWRSFCGQVEENLSDMWRTGLPIDRHRTPMGGGSAPLAKADRGMGDAAGPSPLQQHLTTKCPPCSCTAVGTT